MPPSVFVNLPLASIARGAPYLDLFLEQGINPELGINAFALDELSERWHQRMARRLREDGLRCAVHLPFMDLRPGASDPAILAVTRERLDRAMGLALEYGAAHMVGHACFVPGMDGCREQEWLETSTSTWAGLLEGHESAPLLCLENTYETACQPILDLLSRLPEDRAGACLDLGHWHSFARGCERRDLKAWLMALGPRLKHLHLHDNDGSGDQHLGLGQGSIPFDELFATLTRSGRTPSMTLEPHTLEDYEHSSRFMTEHPDWFIGKNA
ncbi:sugar phosphate isomerase/epimerase family protein [Desulfovibrio ferrophilus]|uniref:Sugar phosphate isomerase/epimerase n=1 Tax=Desulfovibrio ferrophilus TaxID=241368 RepID=A0A2Z6B225_9BACT|nr:sugar phosphate isomerase/epimerase family protein [Desulfovibrio ferrophilus]BBD09480.1 sugar phosphate isomerase/epimerase [Desulfovibrio ferrophilus]